MSNIRYELIKDVVRHKVGNFMPLHAIWDLKTSFFTLGLHIRLQTHAWSLDTPQASTFMHLACSQGSDLTTSTSGVSQLSRGGIKPTKGSIEKTLT